MGHELTGMPGDVVITHLHVYHGVSPNVSGVFRLMLGKAVYRAASSWPRRCDGVAWSGGEGPPNVPADGVAGPIRAR